QASSGGPCGRRRSSRTGSGEPGSAAAGSKRPEERNLSRSVAYIATMRIVAGLALLAALASPGGSQTPIPPRLAEMESEGQKGTFPKVTSVLIQKDGRLVYEKYFDDGSEAALRNTRSATKTITSLLVGIAVDRKRLPGVEARVLDYLPGRTFQNPDPRKAQI